MRVLFFSQQALKRGVEGTLVRDPSGPAVWVAVWIDHFVIADGESPDAAGRSLARVVLGELAIARREKREPFIDLEPAPEEYQRMWGAAVALPTSMLDAETPSKGGPDITIGGLSVEIKPVGERVHKGQQRGRRRRVGRKPRLAADARLFADHL